MKSTAKKQKFVVTTATTFAKNAGNYISQACFGKETVVVTRQGKPAVALVPLEEVVLSNADRDILLEALANPPKPNAALTKAMREYKSRHTG